MAAEALGREWAEERLRLAFRRESRNFQAWQIDEEPPTPGTLKFLHRFREWFSDLRAGARVRPVLRPERGRFGEDRAAEFVSRELGYRILARNWRSPRDRRDELDLVCRDGEVLVFVEVRLRSARARVPAYYSVGPKKKRILQRTCKQYLARLPNPPKHFRFDVVALALSDDGRYELKHYANVPLFPKHYTAQR